MGGGGGNRKRRTCEPRERFKDARKKSVNNKRASLIRNLEPSRETSVCLSWGDTSRVKQPAVIARKNSQGDLKSCVALRCVALRCLRLFLLARINVWKGWVPCGQGGTTQAT